MKKNLIKFSFYNIFFIVFIHLSCTSCVDKKNTVQKNLVKQSDKKGTLSIQTNVNDVEIYIDEAYSAFIRNKTKKLHLKFGTYTLKFCKSQYFPVSKKIRILTSELLPIKIKLYKISKKKQKENIQQKDISRKKRIVKNVDKNKKKHSQQRHFVKHKMVTKWQYNNKKANNLRNSRSELSGTLGGTTRYNNKKANNLRNSRSELSGTLGGTTRYHNKKVDNQKIAQGGTIGILSTGNTNNDKKKPTKQIHLTKYKIKTKIKKVRYVYNAKVVYIPPGKYKMGSPVTEPYRDSDETLHEVKLTKGFWMWESELTSKQFLSVMKYIPRKLKTCKKLDLCPQPITWHESAMFCNYLSRKQGLEQCFYCVINRYKNVACAVKTKYKKKDNYHNCSGWRFPTEEEWEYAYRAGTTTPFYTGNCISTNQANYNGTPIIACEPGKNRGKITPIKSFQPNSWGLFDMPGNLWEWTATDSSYGAMIIRGGSHLSDARGIRAAYRARISKGFYYHSSYGYMGFRPVRSE